MFPIEEADVSISAAWIVLGTTRGSNEPTSGKNSRAGPDASRAEWFRMQSPLGDPCVAPAPSPEAKKKSRSPNWEPGSAESA